MADDDLGAFWDGRANVEAGREAARPAKQIHTDLLWREIRRCIGGRAGLAILDAGGGSGRFSIPLAEAGHHLVHLDISTQMLHLAQQGSMARAIAGIEFVQGNIQDLSRFRDSSFDLVLCLDSPLSYCFDSYTVALSEMVRVSRSHLVLCVMNRTGVIAEGGVNFDLKNFGRLKTVLDVHSTGVLAVTDELRQFIPTLIPTWHAFTPDELCNLVEASGCRMERLSAPGSLARFVDPDLLQKMYADRDAYENFLDYTELYDSNVYMLGVGAAGAGGLLVTVVKRI